jgi:peptidyl-prolyl cis-trans isomerase B (cyclophilin B)
MLLRCGPYTLAGVPRRWITGATGVAQEGTPIVARTKTRERALARAKLERQIARRAAAARRRRQLQAGVGAGIALVLVVVGVLWVTGVFEPKKPKTPAADCLWSPVSGDGVKDVGTPPTTGIAKTGTQLMTVTTNQGVIQIQLDVKAAPCTAASFTYLAAKQFFNNTKCHRLTDSGSYILQCGDPAGAGIGGPAYSFADENLPAPPEASASASAASASPSTSASAAASASPTASEQTVLYRAGTVAMANTGANSNGSQFFIVYKDSQFPPKYNVFGQVIQGLDVVQKIAAAGIKAGGTTANDGPPKNDVIIQSLVVNSPATASGSPQPSGSASPSGAPSGSATPSASASPAS